MGGMGTGLGIALSMVLTIAGGALAQTSLLEVKSRDALAPDAPKLLAPAVIDRGTLGGGYGEPPLTRLVRQGDLVLHVLWRPRADVVELHVEKVAGSNADGE